MNSTKSLVLATTIASLPILGAGYGIIRDNCGPIFPKKDKGVVVNIDYEAKMEKAAIDWNTALDAYGRAQISKDSLLKVRKNIEDDIKIK